MDLLLGLSTKNLINLTFQKGNKVEPKYYLRFVFAFMRSLYNTINNRKEIKEVTEDIQSIIVADPVFILGHWRSGTTFLHNMLINDDNFAYPNIFEISNPGSFLSREDKVFNQINSLSNHKRPMDNIEINLASPGEDEFAISALSLLSPLFSWVFPKNSNNYNNYLTLENISDEEVKRWENSFLTFLQKLTIRYNKRLLLKSPTHTGKVSNILKLFPNAKFIHIYRNQESVFRSTRNLYNEIVPLTCLQKLEENELDSTISNNYRDLYIKYLKDRELIKKTNLIEINYDDLVKNKLEIITNIYDHLNLELTNDFQEKLKNYIGQQKNYKTNKHVELNDKQKKMIQNEWSFINDEFSKDNTIVN